ncbi:MAG: hypothetical protein GYB50_20280 [Rhodobacteraceae bacterium]|nr:hypothetical protein [Paracoccaceae bacterium]
MTFFPAGFDPRAAVVRLFDLVELDTPDGVVRFWIGGEGTFTDVNGAAWYGSQILEVSALESALNGVAPAGSISVSYFQDPDAPSVVSELREHGIDYLVGREIRFFVQPFATLEQIYAPVFPPVRVCTRVMRSLTLAANGPLERSISIGFEAWSEHRRNARRIVLNTGGHAELIGEANPSLEFIPTTDFQEEKLWK